MAKEDESNKDKPPEVPEGFVLVKQDELDQLKTAGRASEEVIKRLDFLESRIIERPTPPPTQTGPTLEQAVADIDQQIADIDKQLDLVTDDLADGKKPSTSLSALNRKRSELVENKMNLRWGSQFDRLANEGLGTIAALTKDVSKSKMPYLAVPDVAKDFEATLQRLSPAARANSQTMQETYNLAVGRHIESVAEFKVEQVNRKLAEQATQDKGDVAVRGKRSKGTGSVPTFEEYFGEEESKRFLNGRTPLEFVKRLGYASVEDYIKLAQEQESEGGVQ